MKWNIGGPDLPLELLQFLEDDRLVLFCGAGVSCRAGLPDFRGLVDEVYRRTNQAMADPEKAEHKDRNFDRVLWLLENRIGHRIVRTAVVEALFLSESADLTTHRSLLALATNRDRVCRLVTTNFDRGFELVAGTGAVIDSAPRLPVPKVGAWNSIVHLHGRICDADPVGGSLVMTSADFGSAYLTERWASRFLTDLFRRFAVLFVGYSVEDPVVRYMMDAFAADRAQGESVGKAYVLADCAKGKEVEEAPAWEAKGVIPLPYDRSNNYAALHLTLSLWAKHHSRGLLGKEIIVQRHATKVPTKPFNQDPAVSQLVWALREHSGHVAKLFAQLDPTPPVEWLEVFEEEKLLALPNAQGASYDGRGGGVPLADQGAGTTCAPGLHPVSRGLGQWITKHLDKLAVFDWALRSGSVLHPEFRWLVRRRLAERPKIPSALRQIWKALCSEAGLVRSAVAGDSSELAEPLKSGEWDIQLRYGILAALSPVLEFRPSFHRVICPQDQRDDEAISHIADVEVVTQCKDGAGLLVEAIRQSSISQEILSDLADDLTSLLSRAMQLFDMVQKANPRSDQSYSHQPSISPRRQNSGSHTWTVLLELCRDSWTALLSADSGRARRLVERWRTLRYPVFRRLCFFAMTESDLYSPSDCLAYMLEDDSRWLWSAYVEREKFRLLNSVWPRLDPKGAEELVAQILIGRPRSMLPCDISEDEFEQIANREVLHHLAKLQRTGRPLPPVGAGKLAELSVRYPDWRLGDDDRSEFRVSIEAGLGGRPVENPDEFLKLFDSEVIERLGAAEPKDGDLSRWRNLLGVNPTRSSGLLGAMAQAESWKGSVWCAALESFGVQKRILPQWPTLAPILASAPDSLIDEVLVPLAWCLKEVAEAVEEGSRPLFWKVWDRLQPCAFRDATEDGPDVLMAALNRPSGYLTQALLDFMASLQPQRASDLPEDVWARLTLLAKGEGQSYKLARVLLASRLAWLHKLNPAWVEQNLLPFFDWKRSPEAPAVWHGYLWQPRVTLELWPHIKTHFLDAVREKHQLGDSYHEICQLFGAICIDVPEWLTDEETRENLRALDSKGLAAVARVVRNRLEGSGPGSEALWRDQIGPWLDRVWPKDLKMRDPDVSEDLALAVTYAGSSFGHAVTSIAPILVSANFPSRVWDRLSESGLAKSEPQAVLNLVSALGEGGSAWDAPKLREILNQIQETDPTATALPAFRRLDEYLLRHNS